MPNREGEPWHDGFGSLERRTTAIEATVKGHLFTDFAEGFGTGCGDSYGEAYSGNNGCGDGGDGHGCRSGCTTMDDEQESVSIGRAGGFVVYLFPAFYPFRLVQIGCQLQTLDWWLCHWRAEAEYNMADVSESLVETLEHIAEQAMATGDVPWRA